MVTLSGKPLIAVIAICVFIAVFAFAAVFNVGGLGTALAGVGGPVGSAFYSFFNAPVAWASAGGWPTLAAFYATFIVVMLVFAYVVWHFDLPYKVTGAQAATAPVYQAAPSATIPVTNLQSAPTEQKKE